MKLAPLAFAWTTLAVAPGPAAAKSSFTPPAAADQLTSAACLVQNLGTKSSTVTAVLHDQTGATLDEGSEEVPSGAVRTLAATMNQFGVYCEFTGLTRTVRGYLHLYETSTELLLPAGK